MQVIWPKRLKSPWAAGLAVVVVLIGLLGSLRWPLPVDRMDSGLRHALERNTGYVVERFGDVNFTALPWPTLQITGLELRKPGSPHERVFAPLLKARINLASWLTSDPKVVTLILFDPVVSLVSSEKFSESEALSTSILNFLQRDKRPELRSLRVTRGTVLLDGRPWVSGLRLNVSNEISADLRVRAQAFYRAVPLSILAEIEQGAGRDERSIRWTVATEALNAQFAGTLFGPRSLDAEGRFRLTLKDDVPAVGRLGIRGSHAALLSGLTISGDTRVAWPMIQIRRAVLERAADRLDGSIEMNIDPENPKVSATLDTKRLDLTNLTKDLFAGMGLSQGPWPDTPFEKGWLRMALGDLRLSAERLTLGDLVIDQAALTGQLTGGRFEAILSDGKIRNGSIKGRISIADGTGGALDLRAQASVDRVEAASLLEPLGMSSLRGLSTGSFTLDSTGASMAALAAAAEGRAQVTLRDGEVNGVEIDRLAGRIERTLARNIVMEGRTRFQSLTLQSRISAGTLVFSDSQLITPTTRMPIEGTISFPGRSLDLSGRVMPGGETPKPGDIRLKIEGPWSNPSLHPDLTGRANRS